MNEILSKDDAARLLPARPKDMHKGGRGRLLVAGGSGITLARPPCPLSGRAGAERGR